MIRLSWDLYETSLWTFQCIGTPMFDVLVEYNIIGLSAVLIIGERHVFLLHHEL